MIEPECAFADLNDNMDLAEEHAEIRDPLCARECSGGDELLQFLYTTKDFWIA